ncbi:MAG TPA: hypothetical protein PL084_03020 [Chitinophagales bacterium]|nr:MAG: hypothetical protein BGO32_00765 [Bacteroidetes bacterium 37-13]HRN93673.1 hypothetical protein [Chitinophagales bacterium]HRP38168.1 hypothetical protein [Chitinophagales bacterium]
MKKVLILAYDFPPYNSVGAQRPYSWYKYLPESDVYPIVVTRNWDGIAYNSIEAFTKCTGDVVKEEITSKSASYYVPYKPNLRDKLLTKNGRVYGYLRKILTVLYRLLSFISTKFDNRAEIYYHARKIITEQGDIDYIVATGEPFILFKYAHLLSREFSIPWHADYRDDWIRNHSKNASKPFQKMLLSIERLFERKYLSNVQSLSSVSQFLVEDIKRRTNVEHCFVVENGVDLNLLKSVAYVSNKDFLITYTGIMYDFPYMELLFGAFKIFLEENNCNINIQLRFVGIDSQNNMATEKAKELSELFPHNVKILKRVSVEESIKMQLESSLLINLIAGDPSKGLIGAKCYSYAAAKKPILSITNSESTDTFFFKGRNIHTVVNSERAIYDYLKSYYEIYNSGKKIETDISDEEVFKLSREYFTSVLLKTLKKNYD